MRLDNEYPSDGKASGYFSIRQEAILTDTEPLPRNQGLSSQSIAASNSFFPSGVAPLGRCQ